METLIYEKLSQIEQLLQGKQKEVMTVQEVAKYLGYKESYIYKLTSNKTLPFYKPNGKSLFFRRDEIIEWATRNRSKSNYQIEQEALKR